MYMIMGVAVSAIVLIGTAPASAELANVMLRDGHYLMGVDIRSGIWEVPGTADPARECEWKRLWRPWSADDDINQKSRPLLDQGSTRDHPLRVTIPSTDAAFKTTNCGEWRLVLPLPSGSNGG